MGRRIEGRGRAGEELAWVALQTVPGVGPAAMLRLAKVFGSARQAFAVSAEDLCARGGLTAQQAEAVGALHQREDEFAARIDRWRCEGISLVTIDEEAYPPRLKDLRHPPPVIYLKGSLRPEDARAVAIVGARQVDDAGRELANQLAADFSLRGFAIVSGLARGIDTAAHQGALSSEQGRTVAVLGNGLSHIYPPENLELAACIAAHGCLLAEVPPETSVDRGLLLARDRIQAALSRAVIVVQAYPECGSMVTARHAVDYGRLLFGVPWQSPPFSDGWEILQQLGARPLTRETDLRAVIDEIDAWEPPRNQPSLL
ncbi:MAG: DNA-protecting protein DprA [Armatimonadetes bacterium]|nr:DNA-protecting protein DprA [Armatimonadota bacterium]